ncbi:MAG: hypothetical protein GY822_05080 [Deltaproteobacteria bacterium]|nr:hypothetical protein [Deltaproteobacteria bacterium]
MSRKALVPNAKEAATSTADAGVSTEKLAPALTPVEIPTRQVPLVTAQKNELPKAGSIETFITPILAPASVPHPPTANIVVSDIAVEKASSEKIDATEGSTTEIDDTLAQQLAEELQTEGVSSLSSGELGFNDVAADERVFTTDGAAKDETSTVEDFGIPNDAQISSFTSSEETAPAHEKQGAADANGENIFDETICETSGVDSIEPSTHDNFGDEHGTTTIAKRPVVDRRFAVADVPSCNRFVKNTLALPELHARYATFSKRFSKEGAFVIGDVQPFFWPASGTQRPIKSAVILSVPDDVAGFEGDDHLDPLSFSTGFGSDEFAHEVTDPTPILTSADPVPKPLPSSLISSIEDVEEASPTLPQPLHFCINDDSRALVLQEGTPVPTDATVAIIATGEPMRLCLFEGETLLGQLSWSGPPNSHADLTVHVNQVGEVRFGVVDPSGSGTSKCFALQKIGA